MRPVNPPPWTDAPFALDSQRVHDAHRAIAAGIHRTPVLRSRLLDAQLGCEVFLKCENFQRTGSFKMRGALHALTRLSAAQRARGVIAYSSGNHAQALALAARECGSRAVLLMPQDAPAAKIAATRTYGAEVIHYDRYRDDRFALSARMAAERSLVEIPPCEHLDVMAGQGTVALELLQDAPALDALFVQVGGGGLIAGCATIARALAPAMQLVGVEPEESDDARRSLAEGRRVSIPMPYTIADGQAAGALGEMAYAILARTVDRIELVTRVEIVQAMALLFERLKIVAEPSGATALAALVQQAPAWRGRRVGVVISGGNVTAQRFASLVAGRCRLIPCALRKIPCTP